MVFTRESGLVRVFVGLVQRGSYRLEQVPPLYNLKEVVTEIINESISED